ncbi:MAG: hypothetical protein M0R06_22775, partial [Sphaerochaeta sp.]|nr:hypothetical protein [Sphaerochaeta sp.]
GGGASDWDVHIIANQFDGLFISRGGEYAAAYGSNTGLYINVISTGAVTWLAPRFGDISIQGFEKAIAIEVDGSAGISWLHGPIFRSLILWCPGYGIYMDWKHNGDANSYLAYPRFDHILFQANANAIEGLHLEGTYIRVNEYLEADMPVAATSIVIDQSPDGVPYTQHNYVSGRWVRAVTDNGRDTVLDLLSRLEHKGNYGLLNIVSAQTGDLSLERINTGFIYTNGGAEGTITLTLPDSWTDYGMYYRFIVMESQELRIEPGVTGAIVFDGAVQTSGLYISSSTIGSSMVLIYTRVGSGDKREWVATSITGTWAMES